MPKGAQADEEVPFWAGKKTPEAEGSSGVVRPTNWPRSEVAQKSQNFQSSQNGLAYSGKS